MIHLKLHSAKRVGILGWALTGALIYTPAASAASADGPSCPIAAPPLSLPTNDDASTLIADQANLAGEIATAEGGVHLERNGQVLEAPFVRYDRQTSRATARGGIRYRRDGLYLTAEKASVDVSKRTGQFDNTRYSVLDSGARGQAQRVSSLGDNRYQLDEVDYSTCPGPTKAWLLSAGRLELDRQSGRGVARNAKLEIYGVPVLYTPYLNFPIDDQRHSGLLAPTIGTSSDTGFEVAAPYYFNIAPSYDATIVPHIMAKRGFQLGGQFRYLKAHHRGTLSGQVLPHDWDYGSERDLVHFEHTGRFSPNIGIQANYTRVSDDDYFDDLSNDIGHTSTSQLERSLELTAVQPGVRFSLLAQDYQSLDDDFIGLGGRDGNKAYSRMPQADLELLTPTAPFQAGLDAQVTRFHRDDSVDATRADMRPRIVWGIDHGGWYANSEAAYRVTHYDLSDLEAARNNIYVTPDQDSINRDIPSFEAEAGLRLSRSFDNGWTQTLEPSVQYRWVGYQDQSNIPLFDTGDVTLNYDQLFANNRYTGLDRIGDQNEITLGLRSNIVSPNTGRNVASFELGRVTSFRDQRVTLPYSDETGYGEHGSDYLAGASFSPTPSLATRAIAQYDPDRSRINRALASATLGRRDGYQLDVGYRFYRNYRPARTVSGDGDDAVTTLIPNQFETLSQAAIGLRAPIASRFDFIGRWNYSLEQDQNVETLAGIEYRPSCCYAARLAYRRYVADDDGDQDSAIMFQFVLRGLGRFGETIASFVDRDVFSATPRGRSTDTFDTIRSP